VQASGLPALHQNLRRGIDDLSEIQLGTRLMHTHKRGLLNPVIRTADEPTFAVVGTLLQFVSTPDQNGGSLSVMRGGIPPRAVIPLHSHPDAEIFYVTEGTMEVFQEAPPTHGRRDKVVLHSPKLSSPVLSLGCEARV
jgi:mannose-6-phosphate isomerase-like protein (cupin superfamily)